MEELPTDTNSRKRTRSEEGEQKDEQRDKKKKKGPVVTVRQVFNREGLLGNSIDYINPRVFDPSMIKDEATVVFFAKRRTGKSFALRWILEAKKASYPFLLVFTNTKMNNFWQQYIPDKFVHEGYQPQVLAKLLERQKKLVKKMEEDPELAKKVNPFVALILDDCISQKEIKTCPFLRRVFTEGRHSKVAIFITTQYAKGIDTIARGNVDYAFIFFQIQLLQKESIARDFLGFMPQIQAFEVIDKFCQDRQALVVDTSALSNNPNEVLYLCNAKEVDNFRLGCEEMWKSTECPITDAKQFIELPH